MGVRQQHAEMALCVPDSGFYAPCAT